MQIATKWSTQNFTLRNQGTETLRDDSNRAPNRQSKSHERVVMITKELTNFTQ